MVHAAPIDMTLPEVGESCGTIPVFARRFGSWKISVQRRALSPAEVSLAYDREASGWDRTIHRLGFDEATRRCFERRCRPCFPGATMSLCRCWMPVWARANSQWRFPRPRPGRSRSMASTFSRAC